MDSNFPRPTVRLRRPDSSSQVPALNLTPDPIPDVKLHTGDYRNYVLTNRDNEVDVPKLEYLVETFGNYAVNIGDSLSNLKRAAAKLGATHVFGYKVLVFNNGVSMVAYGDAYRPLQQKEESKSETKS